MREQKSLIMATVFGYKREAIRVKVVKYDGNSSYLDHRKFSVDPQITSFEVLVSLLAKAFEIKGNFTVCYKVLDDYGQETYLPLLSDWDLDAAFLSASDPYLYLRVETKPYEETGEVEEDPMALIEAKPQGLQGLIMNHVERTFNMVQRALNFSEEAHTPIISGLPPRPPLTDSEFRQFLDPIGQVINVAELRDVIYQGGIEPSLRKVVWKHILNVYPDGMSGRERMDYMKRKSNEYYNLRDKWREMLKSGNMVGDLAYVTGMVRKDVLRTDRHHKFYAGNDDNKNIASLFNILTTYALNHPAVSYCQGMSDLASPLLVTMNDEAHAYICFCALMNRLAPNFLLDGITMTKRFQHLADGLQYYDPEFYAYLKSNQADDLLFCYRWLLLEMKREFAFDDALRMLEVMWSSLPPDPPDMELKLFEQEFMKSPPVTSPRPKENAYTKVCALRRGVNHPSLEDTRRGSLLKSRPYTSLDDAVFRSVENNPPTRIVRNLNEFFNLEKIKDKQKDDKGGKMSPDDSPDYPECSMSTSVSREMKMDLENLDRHVFGNASKGEEFVWEKNPLDGEESPAEPLTSEVFEKNETATTMNALKNLCNDKINEVERKLRNTSLLERRKVSLEEIPTSNGSMDGKVEMKPILVKSGELPHPKEFGGGNPFLMFLCLTVLCQHREPVISQHMDYNEVAMHFDKMVRKHDVVKVLNQARAMYEAYIKQHTSQSQGHLNV